MAIPIFRDIVIGDDLRLVDFRRVHAGSAVLHLGIRNIRELIADSRMQDLCEQNQVADRAQETLPRGADFNEWYRDYDAKADPELGDSVCDERLGLVRFAVYEQTDLRRAIGTFMIYNFAVTAEDRDFVHGVGYPMPCHPLDANWMRRLRAILQAFLGSELSLVDDGRSFKLAEWQFPTSSSGFQWRDGRGDGAVEAVLDDLVTEDKNEREDKDGQIRRMKRAPVVTSPRVRVR